MYKLHHHQSRSEIFDSTISTNRPLHVGMEVEVEVIVEVEVEVEVKVFFIVLFFLFLFFFFILLYFFLFLYFFIKFAYLNCIIVSVGVFIGAYYTQCY